MLDAKYFREGIDDTAAELARRGFTLNVEVLKDLEQQRKNIQVRTESLQNERNTRSKLIGQAKAKGEDIAPLLAEVGSLGDQLDEAKQELQRIQDELQDIIAGIPNIPHSDVPQGADENDNVEIFKYGEPRTFSFEPKDHVELGERLARGLDFETASKLTGARFVVMR